MNYGFYKSAFGGTLIPPELFNRFLFKAQTYLDNLIKSRSIPSEYETKAHFALCEMAECYYRFQNGLSVQSENTDGYSVTYLKSDLNSILYEIANLYLGESGLLYKGENI